MSHLGGPLGSLPVGTRAEARESTFPLPVRIVALVLAVAVGFLVGVLGAFVHEMAVYVGSVALPTGLVLALATEFGVLVSTGLLLGSRLTTLAPAAGWLLPVLAFSVARPEGDLIITSSIVGYVFLLGGSLLIGLALAVPYGPPPTRAAAVAATTRPASDTYGDAV